MNLTLLSRALAQPWALRPDHLALFAQMVIAEKNNAPRCVIPDERVRASQPGVVPFTFDGDLACETITPPPGVTVLLVWGTLGRGWSEIEKYYFDAIDVDALMVAIDASPEGNTVVLWLRSPGGIITGIPETADYLRKAQRKRTILAFTDSLCASAAYWIASQCSGVYATPTADLGSIGVYIAFYDYCEYLKQRGISLELFKAGTMKGTGLPGNPLDEDARKHLQANVEEAYRLFTADVLRNRDISSETMQGQTFNGPETLSRNLADGFYSSIAAFFAAIASGKVTRN